MAQDEFSGVFPYLVSPIDEHGQVKESVLTRLVNDLIDAVLPENNGGRRFSNSDPVTGQAAWYDLRVSVEKAAPHEVCEIAPRAPTLGRPANLSTPPLESRSGAQFRSARNP